MKKEDTQTPETNTEKTAIGRLTAFRLCDTLEQVIEKVPHDSTFIHCNIRPSDNGKYIAEIVSSFDLD